MDAGSKLRDGPNGTCAPAFGVRREVSLHAAPEDNLLPGRKIVRRWGDTWCIGTEASEGGDKKRLESRHRHWCSGSMMWA